jgi:hypothetical protein
MAVTKQVGRQPCFHVAYDTGLCRYVPRR